MKYCRRTFQITNAFAAALAKELKINWLTR